VGANAGWRSVSDRPCRRPRCSDARSVAQEWVSGGFSRTSVSGESAHWKELDVEVGATRSAALSTAVTAGVAVVVAAAGKEQAKGQRILRGRAVEGHAPRRRVVVVLTAAVVVASVVAAALWRLCMTRL